ncbi:MAG: 30S ribosomal protein S6 [Thermodesulfobacteriota bacterium]|nr:30S ribosomal protein S6 [Thermodesulfobacteriota bacterium]
MRHYETIYIINPNLTEEDYGEVIKKFNDLIDKKQGVIVKKEEWGKQNLAYMIKKFDKGFYILIEYCGDPGLTRELERDLKLDDRVLKYQTIKLEDHVDPQDLILKEKEDTKETDTEEKEALEIPETERDDKTTGIEEVKNGV